VRSNPISPPISSATEHTYDHDELFVAHSRKGNLNPRPLQHRRTQCPPCFETAQIMAARAGHRSPDWLKFKNPKAPAVKREAEEDWGKERRR
jgi:hypothetical protein